QNRRSTVKYSEDSLASIRPSPLRCQPPHACAVCQPSPNRFGFGYSPTTTLQGREGKFACRGTRSTLRCQSSRHSCPLYSDVLDNRHKMQLYINHRRTTQKVSKISDQRYEDTGTTECILVRHVKQ
ncbi:unnamed protein product, partial [Ascophyllum nodosum]